MISVQTENGLLSISRYSLLLSSFTSTVWFLMIDEMSRIRWLSRLVAVMMFPLIFYWFAANGVPVVGVAVCGDVFI